MSKTRALITGISGFVGTHLAQYLTSAGWQVAGFDQRQAHQEATFYAGDICDRTALVRALAESRPDVVFHLAGILKSDQPEKLYTVHVLGTIALCEAILEIGLKPIILVASSSAVYGPGLGRKPITERFKLRPFTHYAASKVAQEVVAYHYFEARKMPIVFARSFNLIGPGQPPDLACSAFARQIAMAEQGVGDGCISTGDLSTQRDFVDVRDATRAYQMMTQYGKPGQAYNVCSGHAVSIGKCLDLMFGMSTLPHKAVPDAARLQKNDIPFQVGSARRLYNHVGWKAEISLPQSLSDLLNDWRKKVKVLDIAEIAESKSRNFSGTTPETI